MAVFVALLLIACGTGYHVLHARLQTEIAAPINPTTTGTSMSATTTSLLGDVSLFRLITEDTLEKLSRGDQSGSTTRIADLEYSWDKAQPVLKARDVAAWTNIDKKIDTALRELRSTNPHVINEKAALTALLTVLQ